MDINCQVVINNLNTFSNAYGVKPNTLRLIEEISNGNGYVQSVGVLLRDPITRKGVISCQFATNGDATNQILWVPIDEKELEAVPIYTHEARTEDRLKNAWKRLKDMLTEDYYYLIEEGGVRLRVHRSLCKQGVIEKYIPKEGYGFIRRNRRGIFFRKHWCNFQEIEEGKEVSFVPIISRRGLQARVIEGVTL